MTLGVRTSWVEPPLGTLIPLGCMAAPVCALCYLSHHVHLLDIWEGQSLNMVLLMLPAELDAPVREEASPGGLPAMLPIASCITAPMMFMLT